MKLDKTQLRKMILETLSESRDYEAADATSYQRMTAHKAAARALEVYGYKSGPDGEVSDGYPVELKYKIAEFIQKLFEPYW